MREVVETQRKLRAAHQETIHCLVLAAEFKDKDTADHIQRMSQFSALIARRLNMTPSDVELILLASPMHDIGKIGVPEEILLKPGRLDDSEWDVMKKHTVIGANILEKSASPLLNTGKIIALSHHEKWDGAGYPQGYRGEDIPIQGRICAIADVFDALTSERPYKEAFPNDVALDILKEGAGLHFDPNLVKVFSENMDEILRIQHETKTNGNGVGTVVT